MTNLAEYRQEFGILTQTIAGREIAYLDNAATTLKPRVVIDRMVQHYRYESANVHRGVHYLSEQASIHYEDVRQKVANLIHSPSQDTIIFTSGTTHAINILARSLSLGLEPGDEILISQMEHHSNIVPWQLFCQEKGARLKMIPMLESGDLDIEAYQALLSPRTKIVAVTMVSNAIGTVNPIKELIAMAHGVGAEVVVDGAQAVAHVPVDVVDLDCDYFVFSGHKLFGPTGVGALYGRHQRLMELPPAFGGGGMIQRVTIEKSSYAEVPARFEAGTPPIAQVIGLGAAIDFFNQVGHDEIFAYERQLEIYARLQLAKLPGLTIMGHPQHHVANFSFTLDGIHPHDIGTLLDQQGIAIRSGHHCCQPLMDFYRVPATTRASLAFYNQEQDIDRLCQGLGKIQEMFR